MRTRALVPFALVLAPIVCLLTPVSGRGQAPPLPRSRALPVASWWSRGGSTVRLPIAAGTLEVTVVPDGGSALRLAGDGDHRWTFEGDTGDLVGRAYTIRMRNRTSERLKVVVGVDGLNVYAKEAIVGSADGDTGSILEPWADRTLPGWQLDDRRAERFVFSPPEWSEGQGRTDTEIGLLTVQAYRERPARAYLDERERAGASPRAAEPSARQAPEPSAKTESADATGAAAPPAAQRAPIGTTAGDEVESNVRTVHFATATIYPEAWAIIDYGAAYAAAPRPRPWPAEDLLGLTLRPARDGVRVAYVTAGSAADQAGLAADDLIVRLDTTDAPTVADARAILRAKAPGEYAFVRVRRGPHELQVKIRA